MRCEDWSVTSCCTSGIDMHCARRTALFARDVAVLHVQSSNHFHHCVGNQKNLTVYLTKLAWWLRLRKPVYVNFPARSPFTHKEKLTSIHLKCSHAMQKKPVSVQLCCIDTAGVSGLDSCIVPGLSSSLWTSFLSHTPPPFIERGIQWCDCCASRAKLCQKEKSWYIWLHLK